MERIEVACCRLSVSGGLKKRVGDEWGLVGKEESFPKTMANPKWRRNGDCHVHFATWVRLNPCYAHAHGCTQAFLLPVIVAFSNFPGVAFYPFSSVDEKHVMRFQSKTSVFKFLRRSVDGA